MRLSSPPTAAAGGMEVAGDAECVHELPATLLQVAGRGRTAPDGS